MTEDDASALRELMIEEHLLPRGLSRAAVLDAMAAVPRHRFLPPELREYAYDDTALQIGSPDETISQPYVVAWMLELAAVEPGERILEIGTGSGYAAAVAAASGAEVWSIERSAELSRRAGRILSAVGLTAHLAVGDGWEGLASEAPFRAIIVGCAVPEPSPRWLEQLADRGRLVVPVGPGAEQRMLVLTRSGADFSRDDLGPVAFVPLRRG